MHKIELELDEQTVEQARQLAELRHTTLEEWLKTMIEQLILTRSVNLTAWEAEKEFIQQRLARGPLSASPQRNWKREDIYNARFSR